MASTPSAVRSEPFRYGSDELVILVAAGASVPDAPGILFANEPFCRTFGYGADALLGRSTSCLHGERTNLADIARMHDLLRTGSGASGGTLLYSRSGEAIYTEWTAAIVDDATYGRVVRAEGYVVDRRKPGDGDLRSLITAIENASDAIVVYELSDSDDRPHVQYANGAAEQLTGFTRQELETATRLGPLTDRGSVQAIVAAMKRGETVRSQQRLYRKDGTAYWAEVNVRPLVESAPGMWRWISIERDITEHVEREGWLTAERDAYSTLAAAAKVFLDSHDRAQLQTTHAASREHLLAAGRREAADVLDSMYESALRRLMLFEESVQRRDETADAQAAQADGMTMLAHDVRGPLNTIIGFAELIAEEASAIPDLVEYSQLIARAATRVLDITNEVVVGAQLERNDYQPALERFDLLSLVESVIALLPGGNRATFDFVDERVDVEADLAGVRHIISNLASNALKYSDVALPIDVVVRCAGDRVTLAFRDFGMGIPEDEIPTVFERFTRASNARASSVRGTGLGLHFVKQLVERGRGTIGVESCVGEGTTVTVALPLRTLTSFDLPVIVSIETAGEDRSLIASELRKHGYVVRVVATVAACEAIMRHDRTGLVIADLDSLGHEALELLRADCRTRSVPALTTGESCDSAEALQLRKPFVALDLLRKVESLVPLVPL